MMQAMRGRCSAAMALDKSGEVAYNLRVLLDEMVPLAVSHQEGRLAQLARASRLHREGRGFESLSAHQ